MKHINPQNILILVILLVGLLVARNLTQKPQTIQSQAVASAEIIAPKADMKVLGTTQVRAKAETKEAVEDLRAVLRINEVEVTTLSIQRLDENTIGISGPWESGKHPVGQYKLEIILYGTKTDPPSVLSNMNIPITIVAP